MRYSVAVLLTLAIATAGLTMPGRRTAKADAPLQHVTVVVFDSRFELSRTTLAPGKVVFTVINRGQAIHNFDIVGVRGSPFLAPGSRDTVTAALAKGRFYYLCTIPDHAGYGQFGYLIVR
jgi:hypothetical protein